MQKMTGYCHCKAVVFEVVLAHVPAQACRCDCTLCAKKGITVINISIKDLRVIKGGDLLSVYQWHTKVAKHYFCSICGVYTHNHRRSKPSETGINIACIEGYDMPEEKDITRLAGKSQP